MRPITQYAFKQLIKGELENDPNYTAYHIPNTHRGKTILFDNCLIDFITLSEAIEYEYSIKIENSEFKGGFHINAGKFQSIDIHTTVLHKHYSLLINGGEFDYFTTYEVSFDTNVSFNGGKFNHLHLRGLFKDQISFGNGIFENIHIQDCTAHAVFFKEGNFKKVQIADLTCFRLYFSSGTFTLVSIYSTGKINNLHLNGGTFLNLHLGSREVEKIETNPLANNTLIKKMSFGQMGVFEGIIGNITIETLEFNFSHLKAGSQLHFNDIKSDTISFFKFLNYGQIAFFALELKKELKILNSDLGKTSFINSSIKDIKLNVENSRITDAYFSDTAFPQRVANDDQQQRNTFAQLKKINELKGDYLEANRFYALEMDTYYRTIDWKTKFWEKLNLGMNRVSNNHGQDWGLGLVCSLVLGVIFYSLYLLSFGGWEFKICSGKHWEDFFSNSSYLIEFLNPLHKTDAVSEALGLSSPENVPSSTSRFIENISRIFLAYTTYQMVQAFRKHAKK